MKPSIFNRGRLLAFVIITLPALYLCGCGAGGDQESTYSVVAKKTVGASEAAPPAQDYSASGTTPAGGSQAASAAESDKPNNLVGVWEGTTRASCRPFMPFQDRCNAQQVVKMTLLRAEDSKLAGSYKCSYGNMDCFHMNETGKIVDASLNGPQVTMRVMMSDGTSCLFTGRTTESSNVDGGYTCYSGGALIEQGDWHAKRSY